MYVRNHAPCNCENGKYLESIMDDTAIICDEVIDAGADAKAKQNDEEKRTVSKNFNEKNITCKRQNFYILFAFYSVIDSCYYLLLCNKISSKTKTFIIILVNK